MNHIGTQIIETQRLILRPFTMADATAMYENWASDPEVTRYLTWPTHSSIEITRMVLRDWTEGYEYPDRYNWAITLKGGDDRPIGNISAVYVYEKIDAVEIGYCMGRPWWGGGIMTEALKGVIGYFMDQVCTNRIAARHDINNPASGRVMQKAGMTYEGTLRQVDRNNTGLCDASYYSILAEEWRRNK